MAEYAYAKLSHVFNTDESENTVPADAPPPNADGTPGFVSPRDRLTKLKPDFKLDGNVAGEEPHPVYEENGIARTGVEGPLLAEWQEHLHNGMRLLPDNRAGIKLNGYLEVKASLIGHELVLRDTPPQAESNGASRFCGDFLVTCEKGKASLNDDAKLQAVMKYTSCDKIYRLREIDYVILTDEERGDAKPPPLTVKDLLNERYASDVLAAIVFMNSDMLDSHDSETVKLVDARLQRLEKKRAEFKTLEDELRDFVASGPSKKRTKLA